MAHWALSVSIGNQTVNIFDQDFVVTPRSGDTVAIVPPDYPDDLLFARVEDSIVYGNDPAGLAGELRLYFDPEEFAKMERLYRTVR